ncbi:MAG TPA: universal stress protein [Segeticoccus sp.]|uniref:universal stress protein n=1 Tax=Segeticoccus sp. TaxID=2706531 RepID=UPI002D80558B|nr:universal stress protein [Segeticoccus sp.]HET8599106.1 universal stress protein [Segeticoccus sp.]
MTVLIGFDDSSYGRDALALGLNIATRRHEPATVVTAYPDDERGLMVAINDSHWLREVRGVAERKLQAAKDVVGDRDDVTYQAIGPASASRAMHEFAERTRPAVLVVGSSERAAIGRISLGSTVERLLPGAPCPVAVAPRGYSRTEARISTIGVAYDESAEAQQALDVGVMVARRDGLALRIVAVSGSPDSALEARLEKVAAGLGNDVTATSEVIVDSDVVDTLADLPGQHPDLLVCGSRGYGPVRQVLLGSVSARLIRHAAYPVIVVPRTT